MKLIKKKENGELKQKKRTNGSARINMGGVNQKSLGPFQGGPGCYAGSDEAGSLKVHDGVCV